MTVQLQINPTTEFHILRHYSEVDPTYAASLLGKSYWQYDYGMQKFVESTITDQHIQGALETIGSKFYPHLPGMETPRALLEMIEKEFHKYKNGVWKPYTTHKTLEFTIECPEPVGDQTLIALDELSPEEQGRVQSVHRGAEEGNIVVNTISGVEAQEIHRILVSIIDTPELPFCFVTAYPGEASPDFPNASQSLEEFTESQEYWDNHVFIV